MRLFFSIASMMLLCTLAPVLAVGGLLLLSDGELALASWPVILALVSSFAVSLLLGAWFARRISRPLSQCVTGALAIARGRFGYSLPLTARNEIGELIHTFNYMSAQMAYFHQQNQDLVVSLENGYLETIRALANSIDAKDPYTRGHSMRVTNLALQIGREWGLDKNALSILRYGGILHDIGKIGISEDILGKKGKLDEAERRIIQEHPGKGEHIIAPIDFLQPVRPLVRHHHEWVDGTGYPDGLKGPDIPVGAKILNAADTYDAVTSQRPYQEAVDNPEAIAILKRLRGRQIDPKVCDILIQIIERRLARGETDPAIWAAEVTDPTA